MNSLPPAQRRPRRRRGNPRCGPMPPRRISPSAYQIPQDLTPSLPAISQSTCPLFTHIPAEIRNKIYYYTLESSSSSSSSSSDPTSQTAATYAQQALYYRPGFKAPKRIASALLQTCQQIYGEASLLPPAINRHTFWCHRPPPHVRHAASPADYFARMTPTQRAAVQELHFFTQQFFLEDSWAQVWASVRENEAWQAQMRKGKRKLEEARETHTAGDGSDGDGNGTNQENGVDGRERKRRGIGAPRPPLPPLGLGLGLEPDETSDVGVLAPKRMTITLRHTDWWFWEDNEPLGIDPFRPGRTRAHEMGGPRRPLTAWEEGRVWGNQFKLLPSLEELVIEFETVMRKRDQLDAIVQMARDWRFPVVVDDEEQNGEKVFLVAEEGSRRAYTWIGAKEEILRDVVMGAAGRDRNTGQEEGGGDAGDAAVKPPPRLVPFDAEKEFKTAAASQHQRHTTAEQSEPKKNADFDPATEEKFYVVFLTWRRQRIN